MRLPAPTIQPISASEYRLCQDYHLTARGVTVYVRAGFVTDGASIPRLLWRVAGHPMNGDYLGPAIIHDALYRRQECERDEADAIFRQLLRDNGVNRVKAAAIHAAVRLAGKLAWNHNRPRRQQYWAQVEVVHHAGPKVTP